MYRALSIEDDAEQFELLRANVERYAKERGVELALEWEGSAFDFVGAERRYDLVFLDIDLPGINGLEAAAHLRSYDPDVPLVFVTNLARLATKGYEVSATGFVVKPVNYGEVRRCLDRCLAVLARRQTRTLAVPTEHGFRSVDHRDLAYVEVTDHVLALHLADGEVLRMRSSLAKLEASLADAAFVRVSHGCLVNVAHVSEVDGSDIHVDTGDTVYFSRSKRKDALAAMGRYLSGER